MTLCRSRHGTGIPFPANSPALYRRALPLTEWQRPGRKRRNMESEQQLSNRNGNVHLGHPEGS